MSNTICLPRPGQVWLNHNNHAYRIVAVSRPVTDSVPTEAPAGAKVYICNDSDLCQIYDLFVLSTGEAYARNHMTGEWLDEQRVFYTANNYEGAVWSVTFERFNSPCFIQGSQVQRWQYIGEKDENSQEAS